MDGKEKPNLSIEILGESRQRIDVRLDPKTLNQIARVLVRKKENAAKAGLPEPTMTWILEHLILDGIAADDQRQKEIDAALQTQNKTQPQSRRPSL
jgi:hypothetical protein